MAKAKLKWHVVNPSIFPAETQAAINKAIEARKAVNESKLMLAAREAEKAANTAIAAIGGRIAVPDESGSLVKVLRDGESLLVSLKWGKVTVASAPKGTVAAGNAVLA